MRADSNLCTNESLTFDLSYITPHLEQFDDTCPKLADDVRMHVQRNPGKPFQFKQKVPRDACLQFLAICRGESPTMTEENRHGLLVLKLHYNVLGEDPLSSAINIRSKPDARLDTLKLEQLARDNCLKWDDADIMKLPVFLIHRIFRFSSSDTTKVFDRKFEIALKCYRKYGQPALVLFDGMQHRRLTRCQSFDLLTGLSGFECRFRKSSWLEEHVEKCQLFVLDIPLWVIVLNLVLCFGFLCLLLWMVVGNCLMAHKINEIGRTTMPQSDYRNVSDQLDQMRKERDSALSNVTNVTEQLTQMTIERDSVLSNVTNVTKQLTQMTIERDSALSNVTNVTKQLTEMTIERDSALSDLEILRTATVSKEFYLELHDMCNKTWTLVYPMPNS
jgi:hypothetical protein